jgi:hypothetical protein
MSALLLKLETFMISLRLRIFRIFREPERKRTFKYVRTGSAEKPEKPTLQ